MLQTPIFRQIKIPKEYRYHSEGTPSPKMTLFFEPKKAPLWQGLHTSNYNGSSSRKRNSNFFLSSSLIPCSSIHLPKAWIAKVCICALPAFKPLWKGRLGKCVLLKFPSATTIFLWIINHFACKSSHKYIRKKNFFEKTFAFQVVCSNFASNSHAEGMHKPPTALD